MRVIVAGPLFRIVATLFAGLLLFPATVWTSLAIADEEPAIAEEEPAIAEEAEPSEPHPPRDNSEFFGATMTAPVTQRFEMYNPHSIEALQTLKDMGFTQVILDWPNLHPEATAIGLDVVLANWWTDKTQQEEIDRGIGYAREVEPGRLAGISIMDEPERNSPDTPFGYYVELYEALRLQLDRELPGVRLEISHWGPLASWDQRYYDYFSFLYEAADVMRIMPFPDLHEGPLSEVYLMMLRSREVMRIADRELPLVVILQTWVLPPRSELPEIAELRVMAWQAILGGAHAVSFFDYNREVWDEKPGFHEDFTALMRELMQLSHHLRDAVVTSSLDTDGILHATATWPTGRAQSIVINTNRERVDDLEPLAIVECPFTVPPEMVLRCPCTAATAWTVPGSCRLAENRNGARCTGPLRRPATWNHAAARAIHRSTRGMEPLPREHRARRLRFR